MEDLLKLLEKGPLGLCAILAGLVVYLFKALMKERDEHFKTAQRLEPILAQAIELAKKRNDEELRALREAVSRLMKPERKTAARGVQVALPKPGGET